jgi:hypothetical protein
MNYEIVEPGLGLACASAWNACLDSSRFATHYTGPEFLDEAYFRDKRPFAILATDAATVKGVVTGFFENYDMRCGDPGSPHLCIRHDADVVAVSTTLAAALRAHAGRNTAFISASSWVEIPALQVAGFRGKVVNPPLCTILLDLSKSKDELFRACSETRRNKIRRAIKAGVDVREMDVEKDFDNYYQLYRDWSEERNVPYQPYGLQRSVFEKKGNRLALVARHEGRMIGVSTFRYRKKGLVEYAANVSRREETRARQNDLLLWRGIEWAVEQGCFTGFSMAGSHFFLQKFGGVTQVTWQYSLDRTILRSRHMRESARDGAMRFYKRLPAGIQQRVKKVLRRSGGEAD